MESGKANSFKSPVEAEHSAADRKLTMTARLRRGTDRKQSTNRQVIPSKAEFSSVAKTTASPTPPSPRPLLR